MRKHSQSVFFLTYIMSGICLLSYLICIDRSAAKVAMNSWVNATTNFTDQPTQQKNLFSNQSANLEDIQTLTSEEVQLLKSMGQRISKTTTQASFTDLGVFLLDLSLVICGLTIMKKMMELINEMGDMDLTGMDDDAQSHVIGTIQSGS